MIHAKVRRSEKKLTVGDRFLYVKKVPRHGMYKFRHGRTEKERKGRRFQLSVKKYSLLDMCTSLQCQQSFWVNCTVPSLVNGYPTDMLIPCGCIFEGLNKVSDIGGAR